jgi:hypothetical protein
MFSAFLQDADGSWSVCRDTTAAINHVGPMMVNESKKEQEMNLEVLGVQEGKEASIAGNTIYLTDLKLFWGLDQAKSELFSTGEALVKNLNYFQAFRVPKIGNVRIYTYEWSKKEEAKWEGVVGFYENNFTRLQVNRPLWEKAAAVRDSCRRKDARKAENKKPDKAAMEWLADECSKALGSGCVKSFRIDQLWTWLAAHDAVFGKRATNKLALSCARKWCNDRAKSKRWLNRWAADAIVERTDVRLAAVCRLGEQNSRHKKA